ncbi:MAG: transcription termination factor Rho, partial [Anaerolineae bacterium]
RSSTRREELLLDEDTLRKIWIMRQRFLDAQGPGYSASKGMQELLRLLRQTQNNQEFLDLFVKMAEMERR